MLFLDTEDASEGETGKKDREFTGIKEQYVAQIFKYCSDLLLLELFSNCLFI